MEAERSAALPLTVLLAVLRPRFNLLDCQAKKVFDAHSQGAEDKFVLQHSVETLVSSQEKPQKSVRAGKGRAGVN